MKALKLTLTIIFLITVLFLIIPVFLPTHVDAESSITVKAKPEIVFEQVNVLKKWKSWSPFEADSTIVNTFEGPEQGVGAQRHWKGQKIGTGSIKIVLSHPFSDIETQLNFGPQGEGEGRWHFQRKDGQTFVKWHLQINELQYPFGRWLGLIMPEMMKELIDQGLNNLKAVSVAKQSEAIKPPTPRKDKGY